MAEVKALFEDFELFLGRSELESEAQKETLRQQLLELRVRREDEHTKRYWTVSIRLFFINSVQLLPALELKIEKSLTINQFGNDEDYDEELVSYDFITKAREWQFIKCSLESTDFNSKYKKLQLQGDQD
ncbi:hypothetical protein BGZ65_000272, partial [Modicella reniformis]